MKIGNFLFFLLLLVGCSPAKELNKANVVAFLERTEHSIMDTLLFKNGETIVLETTDSSLISSAYKLILRNDTLAVFDYPMSSVLLYDQAGKLINKIHRIGQGPGEYAMLYDVCWDQNNDCLAFLAPHKKIIYYSFSGDYLGELSLPAEILSAIKIAIKGDWIYLIPADGYNYTDIEHSLYVFNRKTKVTEAIIRDKLFQDCWAFGSQFSYGDRLLFAQRFNNMIYELRGPAFFPVYQFQLKEFNLPENLERKDYPESELRKLCREKGYVYGITNLVENERGMFFYSNKPGFFYFNKQQQKINYYNSIVNSENGFSYSSMITLEGTPEKLAFIMRGNSISINKEVLAKDPIDSEEYKKRRFILDQVVEDDPNPILFLYDLK